MRTVPVLLLLAIAGMLTAASINGTPVPPSPGDPDAHPGERIWDEPRFTHYPAVVYADEERNCAFRLPVPPTREADRGIGLKRPASAYHNPFGWSTGASGSIQWQGREPMPIALPEDPTVQSVSGLLPLPTDPGLHRAVVRIALGERLLPIRLVPVRGPWPHADLHDGFPVDADGVPVVLIDRRRDPDAQRRWAALRAGTPPASGRPLLVGDPLGAVDGDTWGAVDATRAAYPAAPYPHHALLLAVASHGGEAPRVVVWSPGNQPLYDHLVRREEERVLSAVRGRYAYRGHMPRLVLVLPPMPVEAELREVARTRRAQLRRSAQFAGWSVIDAARLAGDPQRGNRLGDGVYTRYPHGAARRRIAAAVTAAVRR